MTDYRRVISDYTLAYAREEGLEIVPGPPYMSPEMAVKMGAVVCGCYALEKTNTPADLIGLPTLILRKPKAQTEIQF